MWSFSLSHISASRRRLLQKEGERPALPLRSPGSPDSWADGAAGPPRCTPPPACCTGSAAPVPGPAEATDRPAPPRTGSGPAPPPGLSPLEEGWSHTPCPPAAGRPAPPGLWPGGFPGPADRTGQGWPTCSAPAGRTRAAFSWSKAKKAAGSACRTVQVTEMPWAPPV